MDVRDLLDLDRYPLDRPETPEYAALVAACQRDMAVDGMFNLEGFLRPKARERAVVELQSLSASSSFTHQRRHNVYFEERVDGVPDTHGALTTFETVNHTLCDDELAGTLVRSIYEWQPLPEFLARVLEKPRLFLMEDPLARVNVIEYRDGEALNWHFDRAIFTTTLLLQASADGGEFEYRSGLRSDTDPNYDGVAKTLRGMDSHVRINPLSAGTINVFAGKNTLHRVTTVRGGRSRIIAVYSYYERPHVTFSDAERIGFYGRAR